METYELLLSAIGSVGFPIVACVFMGWLYVKMVEVINDLNVSIQILTTKFDTHIDSCDNNESDSVN